MWPIACAKGCGRGIWMTEVAVSSTRVRRAKVSDAAACALIVDSWIRSTRWMPDSPGLDTLEGVMTKGIPQRDFWVVGEPVGGYLSLDPEINQINGLYTGAPGRGLGKVLIDAAKRGRDFLQLWTHEPNTRAHHFYAREGFVVMERRAEGRGDGVPELRLEWHR